MIKRLKKGNGVFLYGTFMLLLIYALTIGIIQTYAIRQMGLKTQNAADSVADGVAVYMTQHQSATYSEAAKQADYIKDLLVDKTGIDIIDVSIDQKEFEDSKIKVTLSAGQWYLPSLASIQWDQNETKYQIQKTATTQFTSGAFGTGGSAQGQAVVAFALQWVGNPYVWSGNSLTNGIDCSHFVWQCLMHCGLYSGPYTTSAGWRGLGSPVSSLTDAQAGDIICYQGHVAIYDGNGMIVEAKGSKWGITHDRAANCRPILAIRRFTTD